MQRYFKKCEDFCMCGAIGQGDEIIAETSEENKTLFQIVIRGNGRVAKAFDSDYIDLVEKEVIDVSNLVGTNRVYQPYEDFEIYGFNALNQDDKWSFKRIHNSFKGDDKSWLINFYGNPKINGKVLNRMDYAKLENKWYDINNEDNAIICVFTKE